MGFKQIFKKAGGTEGFPAEPTGTQRMFAQWNAERLNISLEESQRRYERSWTAVEGGHRGPRYRAFNELAYALFQVFCDDSQAEIYESSRLHGPMHFLRMLSSPDPKWSDQDALVKPLLDRSRVDILDYGCGLAQRSRSLADHLRERGVEARLHLADIPTIRKEFLLWLGEKTGIPTAFLDCTAATPIPELPPCDACFAMDFFEHVYDPVRYFDRMHASLRPRGVILADVQDHEAEFMHVSPRLGALRERFRGLGYAELVPGRVYAKP
jgi:SAM-dependent methyltransferase